jgi:hypothetical protein
MHYVHNIVKIKLQQKSELVVVALVTIILVLVCVWKPGKLRACLF